MYFFLSFTSDRNEDYFERRMLLLFLFQRRGAGVVGTECCISRCLTSYFARAGQLSLELPRHFKPRRFPARKHAIASHDTSTIGGREYSLCSALVQACQQLSSAAGKGRREASAAYRANGFTEAPWKLPASRYDFRPACRDRVDRARRWYSPHQLFLKRALLPRASSRQMPPPTEHQLPTPQRDIGF